MSHLCILFNFAILICRRPSIYDRAYYQPPLRVPYSRPYVRHRCRRRKAISVTRVRTSIDVRRTFKSPSPSEWRCSNQHLQAGLFALGAHLLPLDNLSSLGIDFQSLASGFSEETQAVYTMISHYGLRDVHRWIAEGLATTAWLTYADMESGCAADEVLMHDVAHDSGRVLPSVRTRKWLDLLEKWSKDGGKGVPPGLSDKTPRVYSPRERSVGPTSSRSRDYGLRRTDYLLRPEVHMPAYLLAQTHRISLLKNRLWNLSILCGGPPETLNGASVAGPCSSPFRKEHALRVVLRVSTLLTLQLHQRRTICRGKHVFRFTIVPS